MRYSIIGVTAEQVKSAGGRDVKEAPGTGIIFTELDEAGAARLKSLGATVKRVGEVKSSGIAPPAPIPVDEGLSPSDLMAAIGFTEDWRGIIDPPLYGEGFGVAILDSGVRETHELVKDRVVYSRNFTSSPDGDKFSHGTGVASIVTALASQNPLDPQAAAQPINERTARHGHRTPGLRGVELAGVLAQHPGPVALRCAVQGPVH